jgi:phosphatidylglycerol---prolipoprotein diacylglyceryl transferase
MWIEIPFPQIHPAAFTIPLPEVSLGFFILGPVPVRWYALAYLAGIVLGWWYASRLASTPRLWSGRERAPLAAADISDFAFWVIIGVLAGGRLGYVLFYALPFEGHKLTEDPGFIFRIWEGGMSFHGGLIGAGLALVYTARTRQIPVLAIGDAACAAAPIGICLARIANFINGELYGRPTDVPWAMRFPTFDWTRNAWIYRGDEQLVHPSQLYEAALEGLLIFALLFSAVWLFGALRRRGLVSGIFLTGYACARTLAEQFREPDNFVAGLPPFLTMGMLLSAPMFALGAILIARAARPAVSAQ